MSSAPKIVVLGDANEIAVTAAKEFIYLAKTAIEAHAFFAVALSGGSTPKHLYEMLANDSSVPWGKIHVFWSDERHVLPEDPQSNFRMAEEAMLARVKIPSSNIHRVPTEEKDPAVVAKLYEEDLRTFFKGTPRFDLVLLGLGPDGHTASLFPGTKALHEKDRLVVSNWVGKFCTYRITMTANVINEASCITFLVAGEDKSLAVKAVLEGPREPQQLPAQLIRPKDGKLLWLIDRPAARLLEKVT